MSRSSLGEKGEGCFTKKERTYSRLVAVGMEKRGRFGGLRRHDEQDLAMGGFDGVSGVPGGLQNMQGGFSHSYVCHIFTGHLLRARGCSGCWGYSSKQNRQKFPAHVEFTFRGGWHFFPQLGGDKLQKWGVEAAIDGYVRSWDPTERVGYSLARWTASQKK